MEQGGDEALKSAIRDSATARDECTRLQGEKQASQKEVEQVRAELRQFQKNASSAEEGDRIREEIARLKKELELSESQNASQKQELEKQNELAKQSAPTSTSE